MQNKYQVAILDDYQNVALQMADWSVLNNVEITVFNNHMNDVKLLIEQLQKFQVICAMRERTPLTREILSQLPNLKLIVSTGRRNASIDKVAAADLNIEIIHTGYLASGAPEITWGLLLAIARNIIPENASLKAGGWQTGVGADLKGKTIGIIGLGNIGSKVAAYANVFEMDIIAWSENLTVEKAEAAGAKLVSKEDLFKQADFITVHLVLSERTKGIINANDLTLMKPTAYFINTSRGALVNENALIDVLQKNKIKGAALDVFDNEPLQENHPFRTLQNVLATPHIGFVTENTYKMFFEDTVSAIEKWTDAKNFKQ